MKKAGQLVLFFVYIYRDDAFASPVRRTWERVGGLVMGGRKGGRKGGWKEERVTMRFFCWFHLPIYSVILIYLLGDAGESENARVYDPSHESLKRSLKETHGVHMTYTIDTWCTRRVRTRESTILRTIVWRLLWKKFWKVSALLYLLYKRSL